MFIYIACRKSVMVGMALTHKKMKTVNINIEKKILEIKLLSRIQYIY